MNPPAQTPRSWTCAPFFSEIFPPFSECLNWLREPSGADTTFLDLRELDYYWDKIVEGRKQDYHGEAVNPAYLSLFERLMGRGPLPRPRRGRRRRQGQELRGRARRARE